MPYLLFKALHYCSLLTIVFEYPDCHPDLYIRTDDRHPASATGRQETDKKGGADNELDRPADSEIETSGNPL